MAELSKPTYSIRRYTPVKDGAKKIRVFCNGVYDLCHLGHMLLFEKIASEFEGQNFELIVGIHSDADCAGYKRPPIVREDIRYDTVLHCKHVDGIIEGTPLYTDTQFIIDNEIDFVMIGEEYRGKGDYKWYPGAMDMNVHKYIPRCDRVSTSDLIASCKRFEN